MAFLLIVAALACVAIAAYLWTTLPVVQPLPTAQDYQAAVEETPPAQLFDVHRSMMEGLHGPASLEPADQKTRLMMLWGIGIVSVLAVALLATAWIIVFNRPYRQRHPIPVKTTQDESP